MVPSQAPHSLAVHSRPDEWGGEEGGIDHVSMRDAYAINVSSGNSDCVKCSDGRKSADQSRNLSANISPPSSNSGHLFRSTSNASSKLSAA
jgi:hypothetical protein